MKIKHIFSALLYGPYNINHIICEPAQYGAIINEETT